MAGLTKFPNGVDAGVELDAVLVNAGTVEADVLSINGTVVAGAIVVQNATLTPAQVAASTSAEQTFAIANLGTADTILSVTKPTVQAGIGVVGARVASAGTVGLNFMNSSTVAVTPTAAQVYKLAILKG
jgi:hypothetical protein